MLLGFLDPTCAPPSLDAPLCGSAHRRPTCRPTHRIETPLTASRPQPAPPDLLVAETEAPRPPTPSRRARQLLQLAHQAVYRLPATYPGFAASVEAQSDRWTVRGTVDVHCPHGAVFVLD